MRKRLSPVPGEDRPDPDDQGPLSGLSHGSPSSGSVNRGVDMLVQKGPDSQLSPVSRLRKVLPPQGFSAPSSPWSPSGGISLTHPSF